MISKCPKPPKDNEKRRKQVHFNEKGNCACKRVKNNDDHKIYASMARISSDDERKIVKYGDSSQLINWILDSGETCHICIYLMVIVIFAVVARTINFFTCLKVQDRKSVV